MKFTDHSIAFFLAIDLNIDNSCPTLSSGKCLYNNQPTFQPPRTYNVAEHLTGVEFRSNLTTLSRYI